MVIKVMWAVIIEGVCTDINGTIYTLTQEEAKNRLVEAVSQDFEKLKKQNPWRKWYYKIECHGLDGYVRSNSGCADDWDQIKGVNYKVCKKRVSV